MIRKNILYIADASGGGGDDGGAAGRAAGAAALSDEGGAGGEGGGDDAAAAAKAALDAAAAASAEPKLTADSLAEAMAKAGIGKQTAAPAPAKQYSQEDFDKAFHVVRPNEEQVKKLLAGGAEAVQTITELLHAAARQAVVMSAYQQQEMKTALEGELNPLKAYMAEQNELSLRAKFKADNEDLKGFEPVGEEVLKAMQAEGVKYKDTKEAFKALRERIIKTVQSLPGFETWKPGDKQQKQQAGTKSGMPTLAGGGGSGGAAAGQGGGSKTAGAGQSRGQASVGASVFD